MVHARTGSALGWGNQPLGIDSSSSSTTTSIPAAALVALSPFTVHLNAPRSEYGKSLSGSIQFPISPSVHNQFPSLFRSSHGLPRPNPPRSTVAAKPCRPTRLALSLASMRRENSFLSSLILGLTRLDFICLLPSAGPSPFPFLLLQHPAFILSWTLQLPTPNHFLPHAPLLPHSHSPGLGLLFRSLVHLFSIAKLRSTLCFVDRRQSGLEHLQSHVLSE